MKEKIALGERFRENCGVLDLLGASQSTHLLLPEIPLRMDLITCTSMAWLPFEPFLLDSLP